MVYLLSDVYDWYTDLMDNRSGVYLLTYHYLFQFNEEEKNC